MSALTKDAVRAWLLAYAWLGDAAADALRVECIMSQEDWQYVDERADQYAGAQFEAGEAAYSEGVTIALSALYECHDGPHLTTCPAARS